MNTQRRHDIDALRALAFALLMLYHLGMAYVAGWGFHVQSAYLSAAIALPMVAVNRWRMDLVFLISGISLAFLMRSMAAKAKPAAPPWRDALQLAGQRSRRLLLPLVFGMLVVVPIQPYCQGVANGLVEPGFWQFLGRYYSGYKWPAQAFDGWAYRLTWNHLWFLAYVWAYTVLLLGMQPLLQSHWGKACERWFAGLRGWSLLVLPAIPLLIFTVLLQRSFPKTYALVQDWYQHATFFTVFVYGWWLGRSEAVWAELARLRKTALWAALLAFGGYMAFDHIRSENALSWALAGIWPLRTAYIWFSLCAILGWGHALLNRPALWLPWATQAVFPWYLLHQSFIVWLVFELSPSRLGAVWEPLAVGLGTVAGCWLVSACVAKVGWLAPWMGINKRKS